MIYLNRPLLTFFSFLLFSTISAQDLWPDGTPISDWFKQYDVPKLETLGKQYRITDYQVNNDSVKIQTRAIQNVINLAHKNGGGVIVIPNGTFLSGGLFFKPGTRLYLEKGAKLKGSDDISDFPLLTTRIEGETCTYFPALINANGVDGFSITGKGTIDGNGLRYWKAFWLRRKFNPQCTNKDEMRPRLVYISNSNNVTIADVTIQNSPFWTTHYYKCKNLKLLNLTITSPHEPIKAPSTDAIDIDVCENVLIKNCYMSVDDDAIALKGGKGPEADLDPNNGENRNILIEDNVYGHCHSALTCGSESIHNYNILMRNCKMEGASNLVHLKMRPDTPQHYEFIKYQNISGYVKRVMLIRPWTQFFNLKGKKGFIKSFANNIVLENINLKCDIGFDVDTSEQYDLSNFIFKNISFVTENAKTENAKKIKGVLFENYSIKTIK